MKVRVEGTELVLESGERIRLRFLETYRAEGGGATVPRVKVLCHGCRRWKMVTRVGLRETEPGVIDLQPYCHECRGILSHAARRRSSPGG
jgi:hypothetical protein